jgi:hypothetical protein
MANFHTLMTTQASLGEPTVRLDMVNASGAVVGVAKHFFQTAQVTPLVVSVAAAIGRSAGEQPEHTYTHSVEWAPIVQGTFMSMSACQSACRSPSELRSLPETPEIQGNGS